MLRPGSPRLVRAVLDLSMAGPDPLARSPVVACVRQLAAGGSTGRGGGKVRYLVVDSWATRPGRAGDAERDSDELRRVVAAGRAMAGVEVEWVAGTAASWPAAAVEAVRGVGMGGGWLGVVMGDVLEMRGLARGAVLMARIAAAVREGGWTGALLLATSARESSNADLMDLEIPPRRSAHTRDLPPCVRSFLALLRRSFGLAFHVAAFAVVYSF
jgi:hypothetical protein